ncbi:MAG: lipid-A-disaccharide synthase [Hyphomicrobiaceae bacterium]|nr:lipid-A-disaccharide synthase [Hyphomicrobiaceae bacterium]
MRAARIVIIAGEHSGDTLGANLMTALEARLPGGAIFSGVGGHQMEARGFRSAFPLSDIAVMGPIAILKRLPTLVRRVYRSVDVALSADPDVVVIIDAPEFTHPVAKRIRKARPDIPIIDYVSPTIWAWRPGRARKMAPYVDHVLALLPFEPEAHRRLGGPSCTYVGHPLTERLNWLAALDPGPILAASGVDPARPLIVVLPGSRRSEVERLIDVFGDALALFAAGRVAEGRGHDASTVQFVMSAMPHVRSLIEAKIAEWPVAAPRPVVIDGSDDAQKFAAFKAARAALAASGTVTLELALARTPMVVCYRVDTIVSVLRRFIMTDTSVLPNLITGERAIPEFHQEDCTPENLAAALIEAAGSTVARQAQLDELDRVPVFLALPGGQVPSEAAAETVLTYVSSRLAARSGQAGPGCGSPRS